MTEDASFGEWGASGRTCHNVVSMKSQPPLRLLILCREANRALQDAVVETYQGTRCQDSSESISHSKQTEMFIGGSELEEL